MNTSNLRKLLLSHAKAILLLLSFLSCSSVWAKTNEVLRTQAYSDDQLEIINHNLEKWEGSDKHTKVKDILTHERNWQFGDKGLWDQVPNSFKNETEARKGGCVCDFIKTTKRKTGLLKLCGHQDAWIFTYDEDASGKYVKTGVITPPTWYTEAAVTLVDVLGPKKPKFILIEHQGGHGTGYDDQIHWLLGWHDGAFHTAFRETVYMMNSQLGEETRYRMNYKFVKKPEPHIEAQCNYDQVFVTISPYDFHTNWRDWYFWNEKDFSFYDSQILTEKISLGTEWGGNFKFRLDLEKKRLKILRLRPLPQNMYGMDDEKYWKGIGL
jgi:hypothetical protein